MPYCLTMTGVAVEVKKEYQRRKTWATRKHANIVGDGINVDEEIKRIFRIAINRFYYSSAKHSLTMTYELMLRSILTMAIEWWMGRKYPSEIIF